MIDCATIVAIEGAHGTGKTTLAYALSASLAARGHPINIVGEVVRSSPWFQEALLRGDGTVDHHAFVHLFADQLRREFEATLHSTFVVLDRTILSCLGYWRLRARPTAAPDDTVDVLMELAGRHAVQYDLVVYCHDKYPLAELGDPFRNTDEDFRRDSDDAISAVLEQAGVARSSLPVGLDLSKKVSWVEALLTARGVAI